MDGDTAAAPSPTPALEVLIIGAGTTGLLLAQGLKQADIKAVVFERETPTTSRKYQREWGMSLHWGGEAVAKVLPSDLQARINEAWVDSHWKQDGKPWVLPQYAGHSGELLMRTEMPAHAMRVSRNKMRKLFSEGIDVQYGKKLVSITSNNTGVTAVFEDGTVSQGSVLVGCDGGRSRVRELLVGPEKAGQTDVNISVMNFPCHFSAELARRLRDHHPIAFNSYHEKNWMLWLSIVDIPDPNAPETWVFQFMFLWSGAPRRDDFANQAARTAFLKAKIPEYVEPWRSILDAISDDASFGVDHLSVWEPSDWSSYPLAQRVTLAGDAAHTLTPYRGQGLNLALEDSAFLKDKLAGADSTAEGVAAALRGYEAEMIPRNAREVRISTLAAQMAHNYEQLMESPMLKLGIRKS